jgi:hypothetical protein
MDVHYCTVCYWPSGDHYNPLNQPSPPCCEGCDCEGYDILVPEDSPATARLHTRNE